MKYDFSAIVTKVQDTFKQSELKNKVGVGSKLKVFSDDDFLKLGKWWSEPTKMAGLPYGACTLIAGEPDSGKSSLCIQTMLAAQQQGVAIIFCETEKKCNKNDLVSWGVDPDQVMLIQTSLAEQAFELTNRSIDQFREAYPTQPLLVIIDSIGNLITNRDAEMNLIESSSKPGGHGTINRIGIAGIIARMEADCKMCVLLVSYVYDNIGSVGKTNAGGKALGYYSSLIYQTSRKAWYERTQDGQKIRAGADVMYRLYKNHICKENPGAKQIVWRITKDGITHLESSED